VESVTRNLVHFPVIDTRTNKHVKTQDDARPGGIKFDKSSPQIFVTLAERPIWHRGPKEASTGFHLAVTGVQGNVSLALDDKDHRLFAGSRNPPISDRLRHCLGQTDQPGEGIAGIDDLWYGREESSHLCIGGRGTDVGFVYVYQQKGTDQYELVSKIPTAASAALPCGCRN